MAWTVWDVSMRLCATRAMGARAWRGALCAAALVAAATSATASGAQEPAQLPAEEQVVDVQIVGNRVVPTTKILAEIKTRTGRRFDQGVVQEDVRRLNATRKFLDVKPMIQQAAGGKAVIFQVFERPMAAEVIYEGNKSIKDKTLKEQTGLDKGSPLDPYAVTEGQRKIEQYYRDRGYNSVRVTIFEGTGPQDQRIVYLIDEGPSQKVSWVSFVGNSDAIASDARLRTQIQTKPPFLWMFSGYVDRKKIDDDIERLKSYYRGLGFFSVDISRELDYSESEGWLHVTYIINEGVRYQVRNVTFVGASKFTTAQLSQDIKLHGNQPFDQAAMNKDVSTIKDIYGGQGYIDTEIQPTPRFLDDQPGMMDVVYEIKEGDRYRVGRINVHIKGDTPHTRESTVVNRISLRPGDIVDTRKLRASTRRVQSSQLFLADPAKGQMPKIVFSAPDKDKDKEEGEKAVAGRPKSPDGYRGQSPDLWPAGDHHQRGRTTSAQDHQGDHLIDIDIYPGESDPAEDERAAAPAGRPPW